ncbi:amino acid adenylation domain-containing protein [Streptomyces sp. ISL-112]|uniref:non-ribosomal peptide synthetase n=1 Tax=unclassified Streptomyces TaxID=2593676 RepID=UPI001BE79FA1|nr:MULTISPECIES: non-ribosomal peptide synthetase [unclassified Streptomyces]MBT2427760.1 amino acid adenylation domain-containing protein [Streptomyces sp. ISL-112]MBT2464541.1 amino acid adenylation domain-containing protein [Streptomyces sp. ISL-63]
MTDAPHDGISLHTLALTAAQRGLWFAQRIDAENPSYNVAEYADIQGRIAPELLRAAVRRVADEREALRLTFGERDGIPFQRVHESADIAVPLVDLSQYDDPYAEALRRMEVSLGRPADIATGPLVRMTLYRLAEERHLFHQQVHHLALDGYGAVLALARIAEVYTDAATPAAAGEGPRPVPALAALVEEEETYRTSGKHRKDGEFWADYLAGAPAPTGLAEERRSPGHGSLRVRREFSASDAERLRAAAKRAGAGWPTLFMAAMAVYLHRSRGLGEVVLGLPVTGRRTALARTTPSMLSNVLPMRLRISPSDRIADVAKQASAQARKVLAHQRYPSESLRHDLGLTGTDVPLTGPSVNILAFDDRLSFGPHQATLHNLSIGPVEDMTLAVHASYADGGIHVDLLGNPGLYTPQELAAHHERLCRLLEAFADDPERTIGSLHVVGDEERRQVLGMGAPAPTPADAEGRNPVTLPEQLAEQARTTPADTAVVCGDTRLSFRELDAQVDTLARVLAARGAGSGTRVAVGLPRSTDLVVAMLAVMRTGAAYLPLDPSYPADRLAFMIEDSRPIVLVATVENARTMDPQATLPLVDPALAGLEPVVAEPGRPGIRDAAYVIYTSGSTGRPKGVVVEHRSLSNLLEHHRQETHALAERTLGRRLRVALTAATSFDASWDPVLWMVAGHELHLVDDDIRRDPEALVDFLVEQRIDAIETTPTYLRHMLTAGLLTAPQHRPLVIALGGEAVDDALWNELAAQDGLLVFNFYGPTETTVDAVTTRITGDTPVIGRPVAGAGAYVLDPSLHPLPRGAAGELYLSGEGVARGYSGRPGLTSERFLPDPFGPPGGRMYRTGDLARWSERGTLEFLGRSDRQIKVRGYRVETGEIESALRSLPGVTEAAVALTGSPDEGERLAAYLVTDGLDGATGLADVRDALAGLLPEHMVPTAWATVPRLPLTPNGKLDTGRLPQAVPVPAQGAAPRTPDEELMCAVFAECLGVPRAGRDDNFFLLGGHSLLATRLVSRIRGAFGVEMPISALFESPTPAGLVAVLDTAPTARPPVWATSPRPERLPLSFGQQRLWLLEELGDAGDAYHLPVALRLSGPLDREALAEALADLAGRHESLRTLFAVDEEGPHQRILDPEAARPALVVMPEGRTPCGPDRTPFALGRELPLRAQLFPAGTDEHVLVLTLHHIAADGWSMGPLLHDLAAAYAARTAGGAPQWDALPVQYSDYALWQRDLLGDLRSGDSLAGRQLARWAQLLEGLPEELTFPADRARPARASGRGGAVPVRLDAATHRALVRLAADCGASAFMVLHAALAALMTRLGAGGDIAIGTPVAGRTDESLADMVGFFVNTLVLRADTSGAPSLRELVERVRRADLAAYALQDIPFERVVEEMAPTRSLSRHPLFQVMLSLNNTPAPSPALAGLNVSHEASIGRSGAKFDLTWDLTEQHDGDGAPAGVGGELEYSEDLFDRSTAERFAEHFTRLLRAALADPDRPAADADFLTPDQHNAALDELPRASQKPVAGSSLAHQGAAGEGGTVVDLLTSRAVAQPGRTAVVASDGRLSFRDLLARSEQLACVLRHSGVGGGDRVAVALPRTSLQLVAVFGVLRAGAVYVPLDPSHPRARNQMILDTAAPRLLLTTAETRDALPTAAASLLLDDPAVWRMAGGAPPRKPRGQDAAYVLYTSGSTGLPKGVVVEHRSLANLFASHREKLMEPAEAGNNGLPLRVALTAAMTFDASWDPLLWMIAGHELHLVDDATRRDPEALTALVHRSTIDVVETTPSFLEQMRACGLFAPGQPRPRILALGGEAVTESLWQELSTLQGIAVWNLYGPTETTVDSVMGRVAAGARPHLGHPITGTRARVLDERLRPVAPGATGELYLSGPGLARGYENRPAATAARFLPDPYGVPGTRMYRTGDLVRRREGRLEYVGRADGQVKVRGFRVETGEIGTVLTGHPDVAHSAVAVQADAGGGARLVCWVVACDGQELSTRALRAYLADRLPAYMVPTAVIPVAALPLTAHGKVDFAALPAAAPDAPGARTGAADADPPRSAPEEILCALFAESLGHERVGRSDDFFELGGHSLLATRLIGRIRSAFGVELPVRTLFESTTPAALAERLDEAGTARPALRRAPRPALPPLSPAQQRLWFVHQMDPEAAAYHISVAVRLGGALDRTALHRALADVVARHESLRTLVKVSDGEPFQAVLAPGDARPGMPVTDLEEPALAQALREASGRPFDLAQEIPLRAELFRLAEDRHTLLITVHHIAADGWSMGPLAQDLAGAYAARTAGRSPSWAPLPVQYTDYTLWQRGLLGNSADPASLSAGQLAYWTAEMSGAPEETPLPADRPRPAVSSGRGGMVTFQVPADTTAALGRLARTTATSTFMVLHAALAATLHRAGAGDDITIGTPVAGRTDEALEPLVGFFVNTLALRAHVSPETTFRELLARARDTDLAAYAHQELPFERLVEALQPTRSLTRHPLFQVMLTLNNTRPPRLDLPGLRARMEGVDTGGAKFDLSFGFTERPGAAPGEETLDATLEFSRDLFDTGTAHRITQWFLRLLGRAVGEPGTRIADLPLIDEDEQTRLLALGQGGEPQGPGVSTGPATVLDRFAETVAASRSGDIAVTAPDGRISFSELDARSERIAALLRESGAHPGDVVAVLLPRSVDSIATLLGVLKAGAVYTPIDESLPQGRIEAVLNDARPRLVVTADATAGRVAEVWPRLVIDSAESARFLTAPATRAPAVRPRPDTAAYLIHTSGSTGRPKGVLVGHGSLARLLDHHRRQVFAPAVRASGNRRLRVALTAALSFDASLDPVLWMIDGHQLHVLDDPTRRDFEALVEAVRERRLDVLESTPTHVRQLLDAGLLAAGPHRPSVLVLGGEAVPQALWTALREVPEVLSYNFYGPTEATVDTVVAPLAETDRPVLGTPVTGTRAYLLDARLRPVPVGIVGDLYLAGDSLALGYHGRPAETARSFVPDPYGPAGARMYRTGDRARRGADGALEFAGRADSQVKVRGFRVEPDEIAAVLEAHPDVVQAAVTAHDGGPAGTQLAAYLVLSEASASLAAIRAHVARNLPAYMVPTGWQPLERIPLTPSGKLDHKALPDPAPSARAGGAGRSPRNPREDVLCTLFAEVLGVEQVLIDDDFFALGGHSLLATRLIGRIRATLGVEASIRSLFEAPTVAALAERLLDGADDNPLATLLPLRTTGDRPPLFCVHPAGGLAWSYGGLLPHLDPDQPVYGLQTPNLDGAAPFPDSMEAMAAVYVAELRSVQPHGPYHLFGWSFGGNLVQEVAVQLQEAGEQVALLTILDAFPLAPLDDLDSASRDTVFRALLSNIGVGEEALEGDGEVEASAVRDAFRRDGSPLGSLEPATIDTMVDNFAGQARLMRTYTPRTFRGPVLFFTAAEGRPRDAFGLELWAPYIDGHIENHDVACVHAQMMQPAARAQIGTTLAAALRAGHHTAQGDHS